MFLRACLVSLLLMATTRTHGSDSWPWQPLEPVKKPPVPQENTGNEIDAFLVQAQRAAGVTYRSPAPRDAWLRRVHLDLTGLAPTPAERAAFLADTSADAEARVVDRLLADPRHAERWARHWMDIWRYSDWAGWADGGQIRDSQPHIWRWRDWIVDSLQADAGYDRMVTDMLAADERAPEDAEALRATGFLVRNYKMLSREQWLEDTVKHTGMAFLALTVGCAKCHDHKSDPLPQAEYYALRAIFEPHQVRLDALPGQPDAKVDGLARAFDAEPAAPTYFFIRGDEQTPDKSRVISPGVPSRLGGRYDVVPVSLPVAATAPQRREFVRQDLEAAARTAAGKADVDFPSAQAKLAALRAVLTAERLEDAGKKDTPEWQDAAHRAVAAQREEKYQTALRQWLDATKELAAAAVKGAAAAAEPTKKVATTRAALEAAKKALTEPLTTAYEARPTPVYPSQSTGRRLAFAKWLTSPQNPLTARVAINHVWTRHFGTGLVATVADFGSDGRPPSHPALLDWLAADFMEHGWSLRRLHRLICLSQAYRQDSASGADAEHARAVDADNHLLWRFPARRLEAEAVRDNLLHVSGGLDLTRGGPEIDQHAALTSPRRSLYLRCAAEKQADFLQVFDGPSVQECYERRPSVMPQQALALLNAELPLARARVLATETAAEKDEAALVRGAFVRLLTREPTGAETDACLLFLKDSGPRARELFFLTLLNHHEFLTLR